MLSFIREIFSFLIHRRKLWLAPLILILVLIGGLLIIANGSVFAPFIYTIF